MTPARQNGHATSAGRLSIFVLIDALGWKYLEGRDFLNDVLTYRRPLRTVLGFSSGAIPTMLTGVYPSQHGHWNLFYFDPQGSPFRWLKPARFLPNALVNNRVTRKIMKELGRRLLGMGPLFDCIVNPKFLPWFNYVEKKNIYERGGITGASSIFDELARREIPHRIYSYHHQTDAEILAQSIDDIRSQAASFFFLYLSEMDMFLHMHCKEAEEIEKRLRWYAGALREVWRAAQQIDPDATITVVSDHGMTPVQHHYDIVQEVEALGLKMPDDYLAVYDSTMARFWFFDDAAREAIRTRLEKLPCGRILHDDELRRLGILFPDRRFGELIFLVHPGWLFSESDFNGKGWMPNGMHGYDPQDSYSDGIFLSSDEPPVPVFTIADVYPCMQSAAGLSPSLEGTRSL